MTLSHVSTRLGALAAAAVLSTTLLFGVAGQAQAANGPYYQVELAQPATSKQELLRSVFVKCEGTACRAPSGSGSRRSTSTSRRSLAP